ncbi:hypothetical protein pb186bvf_008635 [Paramecium bursaria]
MDNILKQKNHYFQKSLIYQKSHKSIFNILSILHLYAYVYGIKNYESFD